MESSKLSLKKLKIAKLENSQFIKGGNDDGQTIPVPKCIKTSDDWVIEE